MFAGMTDKNMTWSKAIPCIGGRVAVANSGHARRIVIALLMAMVATVLLLAVCPASAHAAGLKEVYITQDTEWPSQDWRGDPIQGPEYNDGIAIHILNNATVTVTGTQYYFGNVTIDGQGTIRRGGGFGSSDTMFMISDPHADAVSGYDVSLTIGGDIIIDGNHVNIGSTRRPLFDMSAEDTYGSSVSPRPGSNLTVTLKDNVQVMNAVTSEGNEGACFRVYADPHSSVTVNLEDNVVISGMGYSAFGVNNDWNLGGPIVLNMSGNAKICDSTRGAVWDFPTVNMSDNASISGIRGGYAVKMPSKGVLTITDNASITDCTATGVYLDGATMNMTDDTAITGCSSDNGAGIYLTGSAKAIATDNTQISDNTATGKGGAVCVTNGSTFQVRGNARLERNSAPSGGAVAVLTGGTFTISGQASIADNTATGGGGVFLYGQAGNLPIVHINGGTISNNSASLGGGIYVEAPNALDLASGMITGNTASSLGSGIYSTEDFYVQGNPVVTDNVNANVRGNIYLASGKIMKQVQSRSLTGSAGNICITMEAPVDGACVMQGSARTVFTADDANRFFYENSSYGTWTVVVDSLDPSKLVLQAQTEPKIDIAQAALEPIDDQTYTGQAITPGVSVTYQGQPLTANVDYTVAFSNNVDEGQATVTITGIGRFDGTLSGSFNIVADEPPAPQPGTWVRLGGVDRYGTMALIVQEAFADNTSEYVVVANGVNFPDSLAASSLAGVLHAPIILTDPARLSDDARTQIERLGATSVYIIGGTSSVSRQVRNDLEDIGVSSIVRVSGPDRQATSLQVFKQVCAKSRPSMVIITSGLKFPDALSIAPYSYASTSPILLAGVDGALTADEVRAVKDAGVKNILILGGTDAVSDRVLEQLGSDFTYLRLAGADRYETSRLIAEWTTGGMPDAAFQPTVTLDFSNPGVATGKNFPDALAGVSLCGGQGSVLVLADADSQSSMSCITGALSDHADELRTGYVFGSDKTVTQEVWDALPGNGA